MAALPGLMSDGSHQAQLAAAEAEAKAKVNKMAQNRNVAAKRSTTRQPADPASIIGLFGQIPQPAENEDSDRGRSGTATGEWEDKGYGL